MEARNQGKRVTDFPSPYAMRMLDLFSGELGWAAVFAARGWKVTAIDLRPPRREIPAGVRFIQGDVLHCTAAIIRNIYEADFICGSSPCEGFSLFGMRHFHPNPPYPELGIKLFNHTREICEASGVPYVMENVRAAQQFVGKAVHHCGPFYLWGSGVPPLLPKGIIKGWEHKYIDRNGRKRGGGPGRYEWSTSEGRREAQAKVATIPPELANCVAEYAERLIEQKVNV